MKFAILFAALAAAQTNPVGFVFDNPHYTADLTPRTVNGKLEDSGQVRGLLYKKFNVRLQRTQNRMHWAPSFQRVGVKGYSSIAMWTPVQQHQRQDTKEAVILTRSGHHADYPEIRLDAQYIFPRNAPYFLFRSTMSIVKPMEMYWLRNQEMTMDDQFTHVAWPAKNGTPVIVDFEARKPILDKDPLPVDIPWVAFFHREKGYGFGAVVLQYKATKTANAKTSINDGANNGKYWDRRIIDQTPTHLDKGDRFDEETAFVLFEARKDAPIANFLEWERKLRALPSPLFP
ncbi:MAG: hypothetical protein JST93_30010 [Acidobacteria bacterium]|nr:hypothetical protein [Acidobacteriota bacterium]